MLEHVKNNADEKMEENQQFITHLLKSRYSYISYKCWDNGVKYNLENYIKV